MKRQEMPKLDVSEYVGEKTTIQKAEIQQQKYGIVAYFESDIIPFKDGDSLPDDKPLKASKMFKIFEDKDGILFVGIDSSFDKFCASKGIDSEKDLPEKITVGTVLKAFIGKPVKVQMQKNGNFLEII